MTTVSASTRAPEPRVGQQLRSRFVDVHGVRTHYTESGGEGPVIVAVHGGGAGSSGEAGMGRLMRVLPPEFRVIAVDSVGGFGQTDAKAPVPYGLLSRADHLTAFVDVIGLERFTVLGNSQGAWVAARYALTRPDRVERLVLISSRTVSMAMGFAMSQEEANLPSVSSILKFDGTKENVRRTLGFLVTDKSLVTEELVEQRFASVSRPGAIESFRRGTAGTHYLQNDPVLRTQFDMSTSLPVLCEAIPTMFISGGMDEMADPAFTRKIEPLLPAAEFHYLDNAGHQVQTDEPERCAELITAFMARPGASARQTVR